MTEIKYGGSGGSHDWNARAFPSPPVHALSLATTPIEVLDLEGKVFTHGTAFAFRTENSVYLVTAWHVVSGRDFFTRKLNRQGLIPAKFRIYIPSFRQSGETLTVGSNPFELNLTDQALKILNSPPEPFGFPVDVAVAKLPVGINKNGSFISKGLNDFSWGFAPRVGTPISSMIGADIFVLGYPLGTYEELKTPLWKRGSLASEPSFRISPEGAFLIDVNSAGGMSGGPILRRVTTLTVNNTDDSVIQECYDEMIVGVYSGRALSASESSFVLGYGWPIDMVHKIIEMKQCFLGTE